MENCEHTTHHNDCCVCWFKQSYDSTYDGDIPLFMDKMAALLLGVSWKDYCMRKALGSAKDAFEEVYNDGDMSYQPKDMPVMHREIKPTKYRKGWTI